MTVLRMATVAGLLCLLSACASTGSGEGWGSLPPAGTRLTLNQDVVVPAGASRVFIQYGNVVPHRALNQPFPYCKFQLNRSRDELGRPHTIVADEFVIEKVYRRVDRHTAGVPRQVAAAPLIRGGDRSAETLAVTMEIVSPRQPEVDRFVCAAWAEPDIFNFPSVAEIRRTLGDIITLTAPVPEPAAN